MAILYIPNPFINSTTIVYQLPAAGHVRLTLTDVFGKQISTFADQMEDAGIHQISFSPGIYNMTSGVYFCKITLETGSDIFTKINKMVYKQ